MDWTLFGVVCAAIAALSAAFGYVIKARTDFAQGTAAEKATERDDVKQLLDIKDEIIAELREESKRAEARELAWVEERCELKDRLSKVEGDYRHLVETVTAAGICALAPGCANYVPPGREDDPRIVPRRKG